MNPNPHHSLRLSHTPLQVCEMIATCPALSHLILDRNQLGPEGIAELCEELKRNETLQSLSLADTDAGGTSELRNTLSLSLTLTLTHI